MYRNYDSIKKSLEESVSKNGSSPLTTEQKSYIDGIAWELGGVYSELKRSDEYLKKQIEEKLNPEKRDRPIPIDRVIQMFPEKEAIKELQQKESFDYAISDEYGSEETYFSPLYDTNLFDAKVKYRIGKTGIYDAKAKLDFKTVQPIHKSICWLGIEMSDSVENLSGFSFYFNWHESNKKNQGELLKVVKIELSGIEMPTQIGINKPTQKVPIDFYETLWMRNIVEEPCYERSKLNFLSFNDLGFSKGHKSTLSEAITNNDHPINTEKLLWFKLICPFEVEEYLLQNIQINCFPALNRKLIKQEVILSESLQIIPLVIPEEDGNRNEFLCLDDIYSTATTYHPVIAERFDKAPAGTYSFQQKSIDISNVEDFRFHIQDWLRKAKRENDTIWQIFSKDRKDIRKLLESINELVGKLGNHLNFTEASKQHYFVYLKRENTPNENLWVSLWITNKL